MRHQRLNPFTRSPHGVRRRLGLGSALAAAAALVLPLLAAPAGTAAPPANDGGTTPVQSCESLASVTFSLPDANVIVDSAAIAAASGTSPESCQIQLSINHPPASNSTTVWVWLPTQTWNGRFQAMGGGGFSGGSPSSLVTPLTNGYATAATDGGHPGANSAFALNADGTLNWQAIEDFGYLAVHEMTVTAKTLIQAFYGTQPTYAYFNGCSTGGRQGMGEAQRYATDYDGILAGAPVFNWDKMQVAQIWGQVVMNNDNNFVPGCKFDAVTAAAVQACDTIGDGVVDGVIGDPTRCTYDPSEFVGMVTDCGVFTQADADVVRKIWDGPRGTNGEFLWYGLTRGTDLKGLNTTTEVNGELVGQPFQYTVDWIRYWVLQDPDWDWTTMTYADFQEVFNLSVEKFADVAGNADPDLTDFRDAGGKLLMWHGFSDFGVFPEGTLDYHQRVQDLIGNAAQTDKFYRLFMAPGVSHCGGGPGAQPTGLFEALVDWVENGNGAAPKSLLSVKTTDGVVTATRPLCPWPETAQYKGNNGDVNDARNYVCKKPNPGKSNAGNPSAFNGRSTT